MLGHFFFDRIVNGQSYLNLLNDQVIPLMTVLFQNQSNENRNQRFCWAQDGAPCNRFLAICERLNEMFGERVLSLHNNTARPLISPNLNPCYFFLWDYLESLMSYGK